MNCLIIAHILYRAYTFSSDEVAVTNLNDNSDGELEITVYVFMNDGTAVLPKAALQDGLQVYHDQIGLM